jgi:hypothetical protein
VGDTFGKERKLDLRHRISSAGNELDPTLPENSLFAKSDLPTAGSQYLPPHSFPTR